MPGRSAVKSAMAPGRNCNPRAGIAAIFGILLGAPAPHASLLPWQRVASQAVHHLLYLLIFLVPLLGWAGTSAFGAPIVVFGLFTLPPLLAENQDLSDSILAWHQLAAFTLAGLAVVHVLGALSHVLIWRDGVVSRMLPGR